MALSQKEMNERISGALSSDNIKTVYAALGHNIHGNLRQIMQMAAIYSVDSEFGTANKWYELGQYIKPGQKAYAVDNRGDTIRLFTAAQLQNASGYARKNKRTMQSLLDTLNRMTVLKSTSVRADFVSVVNAVHRYLEENDMLADFGIEPTHYNINPLLGNVRSIEVGSEEYKRYFPHLTNGREIYVERAADGWYVESLLPGARLAEAIKQEIAKIDSTFVDKYGIIMDAIAGVIAYTTCDFTGEGFTPVGLPYSYLENAQIIREIVFPCANEIAAHIENEETRQEEEKKEKAAAAQKPIITHESTGEQTNLFNLPKHTVQPVLDNIEEKKNTQKTIYDKYNEVQEQHHGDVVLYRIGDFFEILGENAKTVSELADITLLSRDIDGTRIPMCGIPYSALEKYVDIITEKTGVIIVEPDKEPIRIKSMAELYPPIENGLKAKVYTEEEMAARIESALRMNIREWYSRVYPSDDAVEDIKADTTFKDLNDALNAGNDVYEVLGISDSLVRERAFQHLAEDILLESYTHIYDLWLKSSTLRTLRTESEDRTVAADAAVNTGAELQPRLNLFKQLTAEGIAVFNNFQQGYVNEPTNSLWDEVENCRTIANGIYEVSTAGHGGVMIAAGLAPHILSPQALQKGVRFGNYYCYEEDCDASIPLRELWDKGILNPKSEYFTHYYVKSNSPEAGDGTVLFSNATEEEKTEHFKWWNNAINNSLKAWNGNYWAAYESAAVVSQPIPANDIMVDAASVDDALEPHPFYNDSQTFTSITVNGAEADLSELRDRLLSLGYTITHTDGGIRFDILDEDMEALDELVGNENFTYYPTDRPFAFAKEPKVIIDWSENAIIDAFSEKELTLGFADKLINDVYNSRELAERNAEGGYDKTKYRLIFDERICPLFRDGAKRDFISMFPQTPEEEVAKYYVPGEFTNRIDSDEYCGIIGQIERMYSDTDISEDMQAEYKQVKESLLPYLKAEAELTRNVIEVTPEYVRQLLSQDAIKVHSYTPANYVDANGELCGLYEHTLDDGTPYIFIAPKSKFDINTGSLDNSARDIKYVTSSTYLLNWLDDSTNYHFEQNFGYRQQSELVEYQYINQVTLDGYHQIEELTFNEQPFKPYSVTPTELPTNASEAQPDIEGVIAERPQSSTTIESFGGKVTRCTANLAAIRTLNALEAENRTPTAEERATLSGYVGWGGIAEIFDENNVSWEERRRELKSLLTSSQYDDAKASVVNSFFTSDVLVRNIYAGIERMGIREGGTSNGNVRVLEPSMGMGAFIGQNVPAYLKENSSFTGVELDEITAKIAQKLFPTANIINSGIQDTSFADGAFDLVVGNVPFGEYGVYDENFKNNFKIHDYFIAKSVQKVHAGGLVAVITSSGTMDKLDSSARKYIADRAELVGAIRLPNSAFKNANTDVMTDILFLRKREKQIDSNADWIGTSEYEETGLRINNYFAIHPEMILGKLAVRSSQYGPKLGVENGELSINDALVRAIEYLPENIFTPNTNAANTVEEKRIPIDGHEDLKNYCYEVIDGVLYQRRGEELVDRTFTGKGATQNFERVAAMIEMRKQVRKILNLQLASCTDAVLAQAQQELTELYNKFVPKFGNINNVTNTRCFNDDADWALLNTIEKVTGEQEVKGKPVKIYGKADIFTKRTIRPYVEITHCDNVRDALQVSKNNRNVVDILYIAELTGSQPDAVVSELGNLIYRNPEKVVADDKYSGYETAEEYLSGDVKTKLAIAENAAASDNTYKANVDALNSVQPEFITADKIGVRLGSRWVDKDIYQQFAEHILDLSPRHKEEQERRARYTNWAYVGLDYESLTDEFKLTTAYPYESDTTNAIATYGTRRMPAGKILEATLNLRPVTVYDYIEEDDGKKKRVVNKQETVVAREKQQRIIDEFKDWIFADYNRRTYLEEKYNRSFNRIALRQYDGEHLEFPGMNPEIKLNPHQKAAVYRSICQGGTLLHHPVGAGKTFTMCATAMKLKEYGLAKKPMMVVPNPIIEQFASDFRLLYPNANLLVATEKDLQKENRKNFTAKVATGDWDAVIMMQSSFDLIRVSKEREIKLRREELNKIDETIASYERSTGRHYSVRRLEALKRQKEKEIQELTNSTKFDDLINFEDLGVDYLFVDEAHNYKNKFFFTKMENVAGLSSTNAHRASYLDFKIDYVNELHNGDKGVIFATGTPISNSMTEMYTMQSYLQKRKMRSLGFSTFDAWASTFGETVNSLELAPSGNGYRMKTRFAKFTNLPELLTLYNDFADVKEIGELGLKLPTAHKQTVAIKPGADTEAVMREIAQRAESIYQGGVDPRQDNMLKITSDGKKTALDVRLIDPELSDGENNKITAAATNIARIYHATTENLSTQIVFCDMSTPTPNAFENYVPGKDFNVYCELKQKLIELGVNPDEVQFIHDYDKNKANLFREVNSGKVRVLIGSTAKCGVGTNCQERLVALHHLDTPYRPADLEQREGRIVRQGNTNDDVEIYTYVTERTFDAYSYQILENKQRFISQIGHVDASIREIEDLDEKTLSYAEVKALTASNPLIKRKFELESRLQDLRTLKAAHNEERYKTEKAINEELPWRIKHNTAKAEKAAKDIELYNANKSEDYIITINGETCKRSEETAAKFAKAMENAPENVPFAKFAGFDIVKLPVERLYDTLQLALVGTERYDFKVTETAMGTLNRIKNVAENRIEEVRSESLSKVSSATQSLEQAKVLLERGFEHEEELQAIQSELIRINMQLNLDKKDIVVEDEVRDDEQFLRLPDEKYGQNLRPSAFSITNAGEFTEYYENTSGISLKELCEKYVRSDKPYLMIREYGKRVDAGRFAAIEQSDNADYTAQFDIATNKVSYMIDGEFVQDEFVRDTLGILTGRAASVQKPATSEPAIYEYMVEKLAREYDYKTIADSVAYRNPGEGEMPNPNFTDPLQDYDTYILQRTLNSYYRYRTEEGYQVRDILETSKGRRVALIERAENDFIGAIDYNEKTSEWGQGHYDLGNLNDAYDWYYTNFATPIVDETQSVQPDYSSSEEAMHEYGYNWDGMLPIEQPMASNLYDMGFDVFRLYEDGAEGHVEREDYIGDDLLYGVEKEQWKHFINSEEGHNYLYARLQVLEATWQSQGDAVSEKLRDELWRELTDTTTFMNELTEKGITFNAADYQKYLPEIMVNMIAAVRDAREHKILDSEIADEILTHFDGDVKKAYADETAYRTKLHEFIDEGLRGFTFLDGQVDKIVDADANDLTEWLKEHFEGSEYAGGAEGEDFDEWYDNFAEEEVRPYIDTKTYKKNYYLCGYYKDNGNVHVVTSTAHSEFADLEEAIKSIDKFKENSNYEKVEVREYLYPARLAPYMFSYHYEKELQDSSTLAWSTQTEDMLDLEDIENAMQPELLGMNDRYAGRMIANYYVPGELTEERLNALVDYETRATEFAIFGDKCNISKETLEAVNAKFVQLNVDITPEEVARLIIKPVDTSSPTIKMETVNMPAILDELYDIVDRMPKNTKEEVVQRVEREYKAFKENLVKQPGAAVYEEYYKIHFYEELYQYLIYSEQLFFDHEDWEMLNSVQGGILNDMYDEYLGSEYAGIGNSEEIEDFLRGYIDDLKDNQYFALPNVAGNQTDFKQAPLYNRTAQYAFANNEVELYRNSNRANRACLESLREVVNANYKDNHLDTGAILPQLVAEYGAERLSYVLAMVVRNCEGDARIGRDNFAWAATVEISEDEQVLRSMQTPVHQAMLDSIVRTYRRELQAASTKTAANTFCTDFGGEYTFFVANEGLSVDDICTAYALFPREGFGYEVGREITVEQFEEIENAGKGFKIDFLDDINAFTITQDGKVIEHGYLEDLIVKYQERIIKEVKVSDAERYRVLEAICAPKSSEMRVSDVLEASGVSEEVLFAIMSKFDGGRFINDGLIYRTPDLYDEYVTAQEQQNRRKDYLEENDRAAEPQIISPVRQQFVDKIKTVLDSGNLQYLQNLIDNKPISGQTGRTYKGINNMMLSFAATEKGYTDPRWLTFSQIQNNGWTLKKGTKGTAIEVCEYLDKTIKKPFSEKTVAKMSDKEKQAYWNENVYPVYKKHVVFNASCVEGIGKYVKPATDVNERTARCEKILKNSGVPIKNDSNGKPYYKRSEDTVHLRKRESYGSVEDYLADAIHELGHATGAPGRLNRITGVYGSQKYAEEELCTAFASIFIQQELKLPLSNENLKFHTEYIKQWLNVLNNDPSILFKSITQADKICQYVKQLEANPAAAKKFASSVRARQTMQSSGNSNNFLGLPPTKSPTPGNSQNTRNKGIQF